MENSLSSGTDPRRVNTILFVLAILYFLLEWLPGIVGDYGYFIDEFYYLACADHLAAGYVDHPPLSIFILWIVRAVLGDSLIAIRLIPALAGAGTVFITGVIARRLGADIFGQVIAAATAMLGIIYAVMFSFFSMNAFSILLWAAAFLLLVEIERLEEPRLWILFGILLGIGLENKHTFILLPLGLLAGLLLTGARRHLKSRWFWAGCAVAGVLILPNILWQISNGWPSVEFYRNADFYKNVPTPPLEVLMWQCLTMNPGGMPVWICGIGFLLFTTAGRRYRHLGWIYVVLILLMVAGQKSRPDRIAGVYIILFAAGGVLLGEWSRRDRLRWLRWALPAAICVSWIALLPLGTPFLPPRVMGTYSAAIGLVPQIEAGEGKRPEIPQWMADRLGWKQLADDIGEAVDRLDPDERNRAFILAPSYGQAGAIRLLGRGRDFPPVYGNQNSYFHWGHPPDTAVAGIVVGPFREETVRGLFDEVEVVKIHDCDGCMRWRDRVKIWLGRGLKVRFSEIWESFRYYE